MIRDDNPIFNVGIRYCVFYVRQKMLQTHMLKLLLGNALCELRQTETGVPTCCAQIDLECFGCHPTLLAMGIVSYHSILNFIEKGCLVMLGANHVG